ncbi:Plug domain-containing protein [Massilia sp. B-10]|nr:Plug domain-containing protein [Massilia sp. B-10]
MSGSADTRRTDPTGKLSVTRAEIERCTATAICRPCCRRQSGVTVTNGEVRMRGLGSGYTQFLVNGEPVLTKAFRSTASHRR